MITIAIVGGGPGGLMTAWHLDRKLEHECKVTIFEASDRLGGKIVTKAFSDGSLYEAGVAEIYGYGHLGPDPLREMIDSFQLQTVPMDSETVVMDGQVMVGLDGIRASYGAKTANAVKNFRKLCTQMLSPAQYYEGVGKDDNAHPWANTSCQDVLEKEVPDVAARKLFKIAARSDIASEPHLTNGLNGLKNFLMDIDGYIELYSIVGGNERLIDGLVKSCTDTIELNSRVLRVGRTDAGGYRLHVQKNGRTDLRDFDMVIFCLPHNWLSTVEFDGERLQKAMVRHIAHFDRPAHYLRMSLRFAEKVWEPHVTQSWWMSDTFGGCCVYVENARHPYKTGGALGWLVAGSDALAYCNLSDEDLIEAALDSLPPIMAADARKHFKEGAVHRWISSVNAIPGGVPVRSARTNHLPEPADHPGLFVVGDYIYDATLNGLLDSADIASDLVVSRLTQIRFERQLAERARGMGGRRAVVRNHIDRDYFDNYRNSGPYASAWSKFFDPAMVDDLIRICWSPKKKYKLLIAGSASGLVVDAMRARGVDCWGIENNIYIHAQTPPSVQDYNILGSITDMPFEDGEFDVVMDTALCHVAPSRVEWAIEEMHRISRLGVYFASMTSDLTSDIIDRNDLMRGVRRLGTYWEWSDMFFDNDFEMAIEDDETLARMWQRVLTAGKGPGVWYDDEDSIRYSFYKRLEADDA